MVIIIARRGCKSWKCCLNLPRRANSSQILRFVAELSHFTPIKSRHGRLDRPSVIRHPRLDRGSHSEQERYHPHPALNITVMLYRTDRPDEICPATKLTPQFCTSVKICHHKLYCTPGSHSTPGSTPYASKKPNGSSQQTPP